MKPLPKSGLQCKDIPDVPILRLIASHSQRQKIGNQWHDYGWCNWYFGNEKDVTHAMPPGLPDKLRHAKMLQLMKRGLVDGCSCGCRGDFVLTDKGWDYLSKNQ